VTVITLIIPFDVHVNCAVNSAVPEIATPSKIVTVCKTVSQSDAPNEYATITS
jgi:hypothetical protein